MKTRPPYIWDYNLTQSDFGAILAGELTIGRLGQDWAAVRLLEYATYPEIIRFLLQSSVVGGGQTKRRPH